MVVWATWRDRDMLGRQAVAAGENRLRMQSELAARQSLHDRLIHLQRELDQASCPPQGHHDLLMALAHNTPGRIRLSEVTIEGGRFSIMLYATICSFNPHAVPEAILFRWLASDGLGIAVTTPACVAIMRTRFADARSMGRNWVYLLLAFVASAVVLSQGGLPPFLLLPILLLVLLRLNLGWAAIATLFAATVGCWFTLHGQGPFASYRNFSEFGPAITLQVFLASSMFLLYSVSVVLESQKATERRLKKTVALHDLITENSRDAILLSDMAGNRLYASAATKRFGGWSPQE